MKYEAPKQGDYESGLTAGLMYALVDGLLEQHATQKGRAKIKRRGYDNTKLWMLDPIENELEEFLESYFLTALDEPLPSFRDVFKGDRNKDELRENLENYIAKVEQHYDSRDEAHEAISVLAGQLKKRGERVVVETQKIRYVQGEDLVKINAEDAFAHLYVIYPLVGTVMKQIIQNSSQS